VNRRDALWTIRRLSDEVIPLFAIASERDDLIRSEATEPAVTLVRTKRWLMNGHTGDACAG
jgi:error-prone DNA polymerase